MANEQRKMNEYQKMPDWEHSPQPDVFACLCLFSSGHRPLAALP